MAFTFIDQSVVHWSSLSRVVCSLFWARIRESSEQISAKSSAYWTALTFGDVVLIRSFRNIRKRLGERTPPWGTPYLNEAVLLVLYFPLRKTFAFLM